MSAPIGARYRCRHPEVEAVRLSGETFDRLVRAIPAEWFYGAHNGEGSEVMQILIRIYPGSPACATALEGDWITCDTLGEWNSYSPEEFAGRYEVVLLDAGGAEVRP